MSLLKNQWLKWAQEWGLTHVPEKGWLHRTERVLGARRGLLFRASWGHDDDPGLHVYIRFPQVGDLDRLRAALIADPTLDALPRKGTARRKMQLATGKKQVVRMRAIPVFLLGPNQLVWRHKFSFGHPKPAQVQAWVDALIEAVARATPVFDGRCETCATGQARQYVVVDDLPMFMCTTCQQRLKVEGEMAERAYEMTEAQHFNGLALACVAAVLGAIGWAGLGALTQRIFAAAAMGIGILVAWAYKKGAGRVDTMGRAIVATFTVLSVVLGEMLLYSIWIAQTHPEVGFRLDVGWYAYVATWQKAPGEEAIPMLFAVLGAWVAAKALAKPKLAARVEQATDARQKAA